MLTPNPLYRIFNNRRIQPSYHMVPGRDIEPMLVLTTLSATVHNWNIEGMLVVVLQPLVSLQVLV